MHMASLGAVRRLVKRRAASLDGRPEPAGRLVERLRPGGLSGCGHSVERLARSMSTSSCLNTPPSEQLAGVATLIHAGIEQPGCSNGRGTACG
jgi:hypothetical protein